MVKHNTYETIQDLKDKKLFKPLLRKGLISVSFDSFFNIYTFYLASLKEKEGKLKAITDTAEAFNISERSIYIIIKKMRS